MTETKTFTYAARITGQQPVLDSFAKVFGSVERKLYVDRVHRDTHINELKSRYLAQYGITARQFNSMRISVDGKIKSVLELLSLTVTDYQQKIKAKEAQLKKLSDDRKKEVVFLTTDIPLNRRLKAKQTLEKMDFKLHQGKRRLATLKARLAGIEQRIKAHNPKLCFGSKKLFRSQFLLDKHHSDHANQLEQWKSDWELSRNHDIYLVGSRDETCGNQTCQGVLQQDVSIKLTVRLPNALHEQFGKTFTTMVNFGYGKENIIAALKASRVENVKHTDAHGNEVDSKKRTGVALTYRFSKDAKGWRVLVSVPVNKDMTSIKQAGVIGVDLNADHLAVTETDRFGNLIAFKRYNLYLENKTSDQRQAIIGDTAKEIANWAQSAQKPIALEKLDFKKKKAALVDSDNTQYNRMLSSLAYNQIHQMISSSAFRVGVEIIEINPAYTSLIGNVNYAKRYGISSHLSASLAIGRRAMNYRENPVIDAQGKFTYVLRDGHHVTLTLPERNRDKHVWSLWSRINTKLKQPREEGYRCCKRRADEQRKSSSVIHPITGVKPTESPNTVRVASLVSTDTYLNHLIYQKVDLDRLV
jgi:IS605 OrfB family transposase